MDLNTAHMNTAKIELPYLNVATTHPCRANNFHTDVRDSSNPAYWTSALVNIVIIIALPKNSNSYTNHTTPLVISHPPSGAHVSAHSTPRRRSPADYPLSSREMNAPGPASLSSSSSLLRFGAPPDEAGGAGMVA